MNSYKFVSLIEINILNIYVIYEEFSLQTKVHISNMPCTVQGAENPACYPT